MVLRLTVLILSKGKGTLLQRQPSSLPTSTPPEYLPVPRPLALYHRGPVLISSNSLGAIHGSPPCHDTSFAALGLEHGLTIHTSDLILSKAEILRIQASVFKNSAIFNLPPLSTGWPDFREGKKL